jgi:hypothetical protein
MFDFAKIRQAVTSVAGELAKLRGEREQLFQARETLEGQPACREDLLQLLDDWIARQGADFPARLESGLNYYRRHPLASLPENPKAAATPVGVLTAVRDPNAMATLQTLEASLFFVLRDQIRSGVRQAVETMDFTAAGPPRAERIETIKAIDARIDELDSQEKELIEQAEQSGLKL